MEQPKVLKDLSFSDLIALRDFFDCKVPMSEKEPDLTELEKLSIIERDYLDRYIIGKYNKVKADSLIKKA